MEEGGGGTGLMAKQASKRTRAWADRPRSSGSGGGSLSCPRCRQRRWRSALEEASEALKADQEKSGDKKGLGHQGDAENGVGADATDEIHNGAAGTRPPHHGWCRKRIAT